MLPLTASSRLQSAGGLPVDALWSPGWCMQLLRLLNPKRILPNAGKSVCRKIEVQRTAKRGLMSRDQPSHVGRPQDRLFALTLLLGRSQDLRAPLTGSKQLPLQVGSVAQQLDQ